MANKLVRQEELAELAKLQKEYIDNKVENVDIPEVDLSEIESKLEGVTKAADDSEVVKHFLISTEHPTPSNTEAYPYNGNFAFNGGKGICLETDGDNLIISIETDVIATRDYVDSVKTSILGSDALNESYDTLQEVAEWIESHSGEASSIITRQNNIEEWKDTLGNFVVLTAVNDSLTAYEENRIVYRFTTRNLNSNTYGANAILTIPVATTERVGVMSAQDKTNLDTLVETSATKDELNALDTELTNAVLGEEVIDSQTFPEIESFTREELKKDLFIDLWNEACTIRWEGYSREFGKYDLINAPDKDKPYNLNDLWFTFEEALNIYNYKITNIFSDCYSLYNGSSNKTVLPFIVPGTGSINFGNAFWNCLNLEVVKTNMTTVGRSINTSNMLNAFRNCPKLRIIDIWFNINNKPNTGNAFIGCGSLEYLRLLFLNNNISLAECPKLNYDSVKFMIDNAANTTPITITVHPDVYAKLTEGDEDWQALNTLALSKQITFATV